MFGLYGDYGINRPLPQAEMAADMDEAKADVRCCWELPARLLPRERMKKA